MDQAVSVFSLLAEWETAKQRGQNKSPEELCAQCPELLNEVRAKIHALDSVESMMGSTDGCSPTILIAPVEGIEASGMHALCRGKTVVTQSSFQVLRSHARGGLGEVVIAHDSQLGRDVALKFIQAPYDRDPVRRKRFLREAEITSKLQHPGIVPVHGFGVDASGRPCYSMRFIEGETLQTAIERFHREQPQKSNRENNIALRQLLQRFISVCNTIGFAHSRGYIHRDIKPSNIMLGSFNETLVVDWGLAKQLQTSKSSGETDTAAVPNVIAVEEGEAVASNDNSDEQLTRHGGVLGTPAFMSPEQARGISDLTPASDNYALGATLYSLLVGRSAFSGENVAMLLERVRAGQFLAPRQLAPSVPVALEAITLRAMSTELSSRYASAIDLAVDLENWLADEPVSVHRGNVLDRSLRWARRHRLAVASVAAASIVAVLSLIVQVIQITNSNVLLKQANQRESQASAQALSQAELAADNAQLADEQSGLALSILQNVIQDIQLDLAKVPSSQRVRKNLLQKSMQGLNAVADSVDKRPIIDRNKMLAHRDLGDVFLLIGSDGGDTGSENAQRHFKAALDIAEELLVAKPTDAVARADLATVYERMTSITWQLSSAQDSEDFLTKSLAIRQKLAEESPDDPTNQRLLANEHNRCGDFYVKDRSITKATLHYDEALRITRQLMSKSPDDTSIGREHLIALNNVGESRRRQRQWDEAISLYAESLALNRQRYSTTPDDPLTQFDLAYTLASFGKTFANQGKYGEVEPYYREALELSEHRSKRDPTNAKIERELMAAHERMGDLMVKLNRIDSVQEHHLEMQRLALKLSDADPEDRTALRDLAIAHHRVGDLHLLQVRPEQALTQFRESLRISRRLADLDPKNIRAKVDLAIDLSNLATTLLNSDEIEEAAASLSEAVALMRIACERNPTDASFRRNHFVLLSQLGAALRRGKQYEQARTTNDQSLQLAQQMLVNDSKSPALRLDVVTVLNARGFLEKSDERYTEARQWFERALAVIAELEAEKQLVGRDLEWRSDLETEIAACKLAFQKD